MDIRGLPGTSGIYCITCLPTDKVYVGSAISLATRLRLHRNSLRKQQHRNRYLQRAWNRYSEDAFTVTVLESIAPDDLWMLLVREQHWMDTLQACNPKHGFNLAPEAGSQAGVRFSPESIERLRQSHLGKSLTPEARQHLSDYWKGKTFSPETRARISAAKMGHEVTAKARAKISTSKTGHTHAPEVYASRRKTAVLIAPDGTEYVITGLKRFCLEHDLDLSTLMRVAKGEYSQHKGWKARLLTD